MRIGLVNNMPDAALARTEQQFRAVLAAATPEREIALQLFHVPSVPRGELGRGHLTSHRYRDAAELSSAGLDGLIVTGTEPKQSNLRNEPYWSDFAQLSDWIAERGPSTIFSCLAAHAAVLHYDGIERRRLNHKRFGLFTHGATTDHVLTQHLPTAAKVAHSRWNEVSAEALTARGYQVLTQSREAGVDLFTKNGRKPLVFFQGHPEYDSRTLFREYRRDVLRYLTRESDIYPRSPENYFSDAEWKLLAEFAIRAPVSRDSALMQAFPISTPAIAEAKDTAAAPKIYRQWLSLIGDVAPFSERRKTSRIAGASR
jgi:homoserine O-succinyltransferase